MGSQAAPCWSWSACLQKLFVSGDTPLFSFLPSVLSPLHKVVTFSWPTGLMVCCTFHLCHQKWKVVLSTDLHRSWDRFLLLKTLHLSLGIRPPRLSMACCSGFSCSLEHRTLLHTSRPDVGHNLWLTFSSSGQTTEDFLTLRGQLSATYTPNLHQINGHIYPYTFLLGLRPNT